MYRNNQAFYNKSGWNDNNQNNGRLSYAQLKYDAEKAEKENEIEKFNSEVFKAEESFLWRLPTVDPTFLAHQTKILFETPNGIQNYLNSQSETK